jgi:hypothetical protein
LLKEWLKNILPSQPGASPFSSAPASSGALNTEMQLDRRKSSLSKSQSLPVHSRHSHGLDQFLSHIQNQEGLTILDLGGATQANISFLTGLGHRLYTEDFLRTLFTAFDSGDEEAGESDPQRADDFLRQNLDFPEQYFDGVLLWDALEFLTPPLLKGTVDRLFKVVKPGCHLLAFFHAEEKAASVPVYSYRIADTKNLQLAPRGMYKPVQLFNNRGIEKLFHQFNSVKFFLARDHLREVIITR